MHSSVENYWNCSHLWELAKTDMNLIHWGWFKVAYMQPFCNFLIFKKRKSFTADKQFKAYVYSIMHTKN